MAALNQHRPQVVSRCHLKKRNPPAATAIIVMLLPIHPDRQSLPCKPSGAPAFAVLECLSSSGQRCPVSPHQLRAAPSPNSHPLSSTAGTDASPLSQERHTFLHEFSSLHSCDSIRYIRTKSIIVKQAPRSAITSQSLASPSPPRPFSNCCRLSVDVPFYESSSSYHSNTAYEIPVRPAWMFRHAGCSHTILLVCNNCLYLPSLPIQLNHCSSSCRSHN